MGSPEDRDRAQSELVGTVLMISITIIGAVLTVALAGAALQAISDESQDSLTRDSFHEMDDRLSGLYHSEVSSETTLRFPQGSGSDLSFNESEGSVEITVETVDEYKRLTEENVTRYEQNMGAVVYEGSDGEKLVYQGGGLWRYPSESYAVVRSNPPLSGPESSSRSSSPISGVRRVSTRGTNSSPVGTSRIRNGGRKTSEPNSHRPGLSKTRSIQFRSTSLSPSRASTHSAGPSTPRKCCPT